jgi:hypothetical protein
MDVTDSTSLYSIKHSRRSGKDSRRSGKDDIFTVDTTSFGASIAVESRIGAGTTFRVFFAAASRLDAVDGAAALTA